METALALGLMVASIPGMRSWFNILGSLILEGVMMRQIKSIDGRSDPWFYKDNRIEILANNRFSDSVDFFLVENYQGKYWEIPKNIE